MCGRYHPIRAGHSEVWNYNLCVNLSKYFLLQLTFLHFAVNPNIWWDKIWDMTHSIWWCQLQRSGIVRSYSVFISCMSRPPAVVDIMWWLCLNHGCDLIKKNFRIVYANHGKNFQLTDMHFIVLTVNTFYGTPRNEKSESASTDLET